MYIYILYTLQYNIVIRAKFARREGKYYGKLQLLTVSLSPA